MKEKNIHFVERHVEKMLLGVACVFLLGVLWLFVIGQPYTVVVAGEDAVPPSRVNEMVLQAAKELGGLVGEKSVSPLKQIPVPEYTDLFRERLAMAPSRAEALDPLGNPGLADMGRADLVNPRSVVVAAPTPASPQGVRVVLGVRCVACSGAVGGGVGGRGSRCAGGGCAGRGVRASGGRACAA